MNNLLSFYKNKRVLITGHTGFKGTWLTRILLDVGAEVQGYSLNPPTYPALFNLAQLSSFHTFHSTIGDVRDLEKMKEVFSSFQPEIVLHLAAQPIVRTSYQDPVGTYSTNVMGTVNILECVRLTPSVKSFLNVTTIMSGAMATERMNRWMVMIRILIPSHVQSLSHIPTVLLSSMTVMDRTEEGMWLSPQQGLVMLSVAEILPRIESFLTV